LPRVALFGAAVGTLAAERGLTTFEAVLINGVVFAGGSQIASIELRSPRRLPRSRALPVSG
jgi:predicted branched-subunit amino acid permease